MHEDIAKLRVAVDAARQEFDLAVTFHEVWKLAAFDGALHKRMGASYASNAFEVIRVSLRREMLLALMRLWDTSSRAVRMEWIGRTLSDRKIIATLAVERVKRFGGLDVEAKMQREMQQRADEIVALIEKYSQGGSHPETLEKLRTFRHEHLAHRQIIPTVGIEMDADEVESFYRDNSKIIQLLLSLVAAISYDPDEAAQVYRHYATLFWASVCGEKTEGHPSFCRPSSLPT